MDGENTGDATDWTTARLLALAGERGEAERLAAQLLAPGGKWRPPWLLAGNRASAVHRLDDAPNR